MCATAPVSSPETYENFSIQSERESIQTPDEHAVRNKKDLSSKLNQRQLYPKSSYFWKDQIILSEPNATYLKEWKFWSRSSLKLKPAMARQIVLALEQIHDFGLIHNRLNPNTVRLWNKDDENPEVFFSNLSSACFEWERSQFGDRPLTLDELTYTSPERTGRLKQIPSFDSDLYSVGVILYELFAGRPPFAANDPLDIIRQHLVEKPKPLHKINPTVPHVLSEIIGVLLRKDRNQRYQSAQGVSYDFK